MTLNYVVISINGSKIKNVIFHWVYTTSHPIQSLYAPSFRLLLLMFLHQKRNSLTILFQETGKTIQLNIK